VAGSGSDIAGPYPGIWTAPSALPGTGQRSPTGSGQNAERPPLRNWTRRGLLGLGEGGERCPGRNRRSMRRRGNAGSGAAFSAKTPASRATTTPAVTSVNPLPAAARQLSRSDRRLGRASWRMRPRHRRHRPPGGPRRGRTGRRGSGARARAGRWRALLSSIRISGSFFGPAVRRIRVDGADRAALARIAEAAICTVWADGRRRWLTSNYPAARRPDVGRCPLRPKAANGRAFWERRLPDSNRRPLPYHSPATPADAPRRAKAPATGI
jgi:hypothetical protein